MLESGVEGEDGEMYPLPEDEAMAEAEPPEDLASSAHQVCHPQATVSSIVSAMDHWTSIIVIFVFAFPSLCKCRDNHTLHLGNTSMRRHVVMLLSGGKWYQPSNCLAI